MTNLATKILLMGAFTGFAAAAGAAPAEETVPTLAVHYTSDALATDEGARALYHRIARAAEQVCPSDDRLVPTAVRECRQQAISAAVEKIHNQRLAAVQAAQRHTG
jgi:UrcA family protein